jgi:hypothetical protein
MTRILTRDDRCARCGVRLCFAAIPRPALTRGMAFAMAEAQGKALETEAREVAEEKRSVAEAPKGAQREALGCQE